MPDGGGLSAGKQAYVVRVLGMVADRPHAAVLEAGVGIGITALAVAASLSARQRFSAIDLDPANIERLRDGLVNGAVCEVADLVVGDIGAMDVFADRSFDVVGSDTVVALLGVELHRPFAEAFRVLRPGGAFVVRELAGPRPGGATRRDLLLRVVLAARMLVGDRCAMLPPELLCSVLTDVGFDQPTYRAISEPDDEPVITQWYPLSSPDCPLREGFIDYYVERSADCSDSGGSPADSYVLVARRSE